MANDRNSPKEHKISRRAWVTALSAAGAGFGFSALADSAPGGVRDPLAPTASIGLATDTCDTIADLRTLVGPDIQAVTVLGYWADGDGGGGLFYWDPDELGPAPSGEDGGLIIKPNAIPADQPRRWRRADLFGGAHGRHRCGIEHHQ